MEASKHFNLAEHLQKRRKEERKYANDLLWENIEAGLWNALGRVSQHKLTDAEKVEFQIDHCFPILAQFFIVSGHAIQFIEDDNVREVLQFGASRRIGSIRIAVERIITTAPPNRKKRLSLEEREGVSDSILLLYVHMLGVLDAFAIALFRAQKTKVNVSERSVDLLKKSFRKEIGISEIDELIEKNDSWLMRIKENLRNRYVHRIPPYVPDGRFTPDEMIKFSSLEKEKFDLIEAGDFGGAERLRAEQDAIGVFEPVLSFSEDKSYMLLHPTILDDTFRFVCLVFDLLEITLPLFSARRSPE